MKIFTDYVVETLQALKVEEKYVSYYVEHWRLFNYAVVGGLGVVVNMIVLNFLFNMGIPLLVANGCAILSAWYGNYTLSVGPYGYFMGFPKKEEKGE